MSTERDAATDQQLPVVNDRPFVQDLVVADIEARKHLGIRKYGTALQSGNGRDMLLDAYEEALDLVIYLRGLMDEREHEANRRADLNPAVERDIYHAWHNVTCPEGPECRDIWAHKLASPLVNSGILARFLDELDRQSSRRRT